MPGSGNDVIVAGAGNDVVEIDGNAASTAAVYVAINGSGAYLADQDSVGAASYDGVFAYEVYSSNTVASGYTAVAAKVAANGSSDKNLLIGVEGIQYNDTFTQLVKREKALDADGDGITDTIVIVDGSDNALAPTSGNEAIAHVLDGGAGADALSGGTAGDRFIPGAGADFIDGGTNVGTGVDGNPSVDVAEYFGTGIGTTASPATYTVTQVYVLENANGSNTVDFSNGLDPNADYYTSESGATSAKSSSQTVKSAFLVADSSETDLLVGIEIIEFTDGIVQAAPTTTTERKFSVAAGEEEISSINGTPYVDTITSTSSNDVIIGSGGLDKFVFAAGSGVDKVLDFTVTGTDTDSDGTADSFEKIVITKDSATVGINKTSVTSAADILSRITSSSEGALIDLGSNNTLTLIGVSAADLTASHFTIV
jgi:hypothetical protein